MYISFNSILRSAFRFIHRSLRSFVLYAIGERSLNLIKSFTNKPRRNYNDEYFEFIDKTISKSVPIIAEPIIKKEEGILMYNTETEQVGHLTIS